MKGKLITTAVLIGFWGCSNIEDAKPSERSTFIHVFDFPHNAYGVTAEETADGYVILANELPANGNPNTIIIKTDSRGSRTGDDVVIKDGASKCLKVASDGYYLIGDSIKINQQSSDVSVFDLLIYSARIFKLDLSGNVVKKFVIADKKDTANFVDFHGGALTLSGTGELIALGTYRYLAGTEKPYIVALDPNTFDTLWTKSYDVIDRDYVNGKSIHVTPTGKIIWATSLLRDNQSFKRSYLGIPLVKENSTFENFSQYGQLTDQRLFVNDMCPANVAAAGFGIVGTYATPTGTQANMFFAHVNTSGDIDESTIHYFDGAADAVPVDQSTSEDTGDAITATIDGGYVIAGSTQNSSSNTGTDILIMKVDAIGNIIWKKIIGGQGNETVSSIRSTRDGGFIVCGSNEVGLSSIFVMKLDAEGNLNN